MMIPESHTFGRFFADVPKISPEFLGFILDRKGVTSFLDYFGVRGRRGELRFSRVHSSTRVERVYYPTFIFHLKLCWVETYTNRTTYIFHKYVVS